MKIIILSLWVLAGMLIIPWSAYAEGETDGCQLAFFNPIQVDPADHNIEGFRLDLLYGVNHDLQGFDLGLVNKVKGSGKGFELGAVNLVTHNFDGFQAGVFYNSTDEDFRGLQLGIVNHAGSLDGVQIGILNFNDDTRYLGFLPFINAAF